MSRYGCAGVTVRWVSARNGAFVPKERIVPDSTPLDTAIIAVPETAGSALYGMLDVLSVTGNVWQTLTRTGPTPPPFRVHVVGLERQRFCCGNGITSGPTSRLARSLKPADGSRRRRSVCPKICTCRSCERLAA
jgi:hypothetical protein